MDKQIVGPVSVSAATLQQLRRIAESTHRSVEDVLGDTVDAMFSNPAEPRATGEPIAALEQVTDAQLWAILQHELTPAERNRLNHLSEQNKNGDISDADREELDRIVEALDREMLLRSRALALLKQRGYDVSAFFSSGQ